jgi:hypothetical protein
MASTRHVNRIIKKEDVDFLLSIKEETVTQSLLYEMFGEFKGKKRFNTYDEFTVPKGAYGSSKVKNKEAFVTTVGEWVYNRFLIEGDLFDELKWVEGPITDSTYKKINKVLSYAVMEDRITVDQLSKYLNKVEWMMPLSTVITTSVTLKMLTSTKEINKEKERLAKKYKKELDANDPVIVGKMEKELLDYALKYLKDDESLDQFHSGARGSIGNSFKNMYVMKGAIKDPDPANGYHIITSSYMEGIKRDEYPAFSNSLAAGPYARAKKTEFGGYMEKLYTRAYESVLLDKEGSDCGTKGHIIVTITPDNVDRFMYSYIMDGSSLVELNSKNMSKYMNKTVKMRFISMCKNEHKKCNKCAGNMFYKLGFINMGMATNIVPSRLKNVAMKAFHDSVVTYMEMDVMKAFGLK